MVTRKNQRVKLAREKVVDEERAIKQLNSSGDEVANEDLTLKIVEKSLQRRYVKVGSNPRIISEYEDTEVNTESSTINHGALNFP